MNNLIIKAKLVLSALLITLLFFLVGCNQKEEDPSQASIGGDFIVGLTGDYPPFEFIKNKKIIGFDVDLAYDIANELDKKLYIRDMDFDGLIPALQTGRIDCIISAMTATDERKKNVDFSIQYYTPEFAMLYRRDNPIKEIKDLNNSMIGVQLGTSMETYLKTQEEDQVQNLDTVSLKNTLTIVQELKLSRLDGALVEEAQAKVFVKKHPELDYALFSGSIMGYSMAFAKNSPLREKVNVALSKLKNSGTLARLQTKWLNGDGQ